MANGNIHLYGALLNIILEEESVVHEVVRKALEDKDDQLWTRNWVLCRPLSGPPIFQEVAQEDLGKYSSSFRMTEDVFTDLLAKIQPSIEKQDTVMRLAIAPEVRLKATLRFLATGASFGILEDLFRIPKSTLSRMIPEVCECIFLVLGQQFLQVPQTTKEWESIMNGFNSTWQYPGCIGAIDGKHIVIHKPPCSGSLYYSYKGTFSVVLLGIADFEYRFIYFNIGTPGSTNDAAIWNDSLFKHKLSNGELSVPPHFHLSSGKDIQPHLVGDDIFGLATTLMKPYPHHSRSGLSDPELMFNYRLSRARRVLGVGPDEAKPNNDQATMETELDCYHYVHIVQ